MTRLTSTVIGFVAAWRPLAPFAGLLLSLIVFAVGGMFVIAREADRSDASRAREAVTQTFAGLISRLDSAVVMNAAAPPIANALSGPEATPASAYGYLNFTDKDALGYHGSVVLNDDGSVFAGTRFGRPWAGGSLSEAARLIAPTAARLPAVGAATVHALVRDPHGQVLAISVANVVPVDQGTTGSQGARPRRLAMIVPVETQLVSKMLPSLGVEDFRIVVASHDDNSASIPVGHGSPIVFAWRPRTPGRAAIVRWAPAIATLLLSALILLALAGRANLAATRALESWHTAIASLGLPIARRSGASSTAGRRAVRPSRSA